jgi:hypothetical protein
LAHHQSTYTVKILATDAQNNHCLEGYQLVTVVLSDVNDNAPVFNPLTYSFSVDETVATRRSARAVNDTIGRVSANDGDAGNNAKITYSFSTPPAPGQQFFSINSETGDIVHAADIDFEQLASSVITLTVLATDGGGSISNPPATVAITVNDGNDVPHFINLNPGQVADTQKLPKNALLGDFLDLDVGDDVKPAFKDVFTCSLVVNEPKLVGMIDVVATADTCTLRVAGSLDGSLGVSTNVVVQLRDSVGITDLATVPIEVTDVNTNPPTFADRKSVV